jgi:hypothetical protein
LYHTVSIFFLLHLFVSDSCIIPTKSALDRLLLSTALRHSSLLYIRYCTNLHLLAKPVLHSNSTSFKAEITHILPFLPFSCLIFVIVTGVGLQVEKYVLGSFGVEVSWLRRSLPLYSKHLLSLSLACLSCDLSEILMYFLYSRLSLT